MGEYDVLGNLSFVNIADAHDPAVVKTIDFRKIGPAVAQARTMNQLVIISPWEGIPPHVEVSQQFCKACKAVCDVCLGKGKKACEAPYCGGSGTQDLPTGKVKCATCKGSGSAPCSSCRGQGKKATGIKGGSYDYRQGLCPVCQGRKFQSQETAKGLTEFSCGTYGGMVALGPIIRFSVRPNAGSSAHAAPLIYDVITDMYGDGMCLMVDENARHAFIVGGIAKQASR